MKKQRHWFKKPTPEEEAKIQESLANNPPSKKDYLAMIISLLITVIPVVLLILGIFVFVIWFIFMR